MTATTTAPPRYVSLDAIRGVAVMGILTMNIASFAYPDAAYINPLAWGGQTVSDYFAWAFSFVLFEGKMRGLFSLLFGASMAIVVDRAAERGESGASVHFRRLFWLLLFGLIHHYLIWMGDILVQYALVGMVGWFFLAGSQRWLWRWAVILLTISFLWHAAMVAGISAVVAAGTAPDASAAQREQAALTLEDLAKPGGEAVREDLAVHRSGYSTIFADRAAEAAMGIPFTVLMFGFETLGLMVLGIALLRSGFLTAQWSSERYRRWAVRAYLIGIPPTVALAAWNWAEGFPTVATFGTWLAWVEPFRYPIVLGHAALIMILVQRFATSALVARIAAAGRAAFTNYIGTSLVMTSVFYGYGLGLYGQVGRWELWLVVFAMWALMLAWSKPWLERYRYGPFEWLWRSLARMRPQPMRKRLKAPAAAQ